MAIVTRSVTVVVHRGLAAAWTANNPVLKYGELGIEDDVGRLKMGDGVTAWNSLAYLPGGYSQAAIEEFARDALGSALTAGANIAITPNDGADTISVALSGTVPVGNGGTGLATLTSNRLYKGNGTSALAASLLLDTGTYVRFDASSGGLQFGGDTAAANALNDYEHGTFTPVIADAASGGNVGSAATIGGQYVKIGRRVGVAIRAQNIDTTGMTAGNDLFIRGLPFSSASLGGISVTFEGAAALEQITFAGYVVSDMGVLVTSLRLRENVSATNVDYVMVSELNSGTADLYVNLEYFTGS